MNESNLMHILLVEDDEVDVMNLKRAFKKNSVSNPLHVAVNGLDALEQLRGEGGKEKIPTPGFIILDINMPKMNGIEFLQELRKDENLKHISVFVMTTSKEDSDIIEAYDLNVAGYVVKPLSFEKFREAVATVCSFWQIIEHPQYLHK